MFMVIGGAYQGKLEYAAEKAGLPKEDFLDGASFKEAAAGGGGCPVSSGDIDIFHAKGIVNFHLYVRRYLMDLSEEDMDRFAARLAAENPDLVLVSDEVGCGIIPVDQKERQYREAVGRICTDLAKRAERVDRVVCGIGVTIKKAAGEEKTRVPHE